MTGIEDAFAAATGSKIVDDSQEQTQQQEAPVEQTTEQQVEQKPEQVVEQQEQSSLNNENNQSESDDEYYLTEGDLLDAFNEKFNSKYSSLDDVSNVMDKGQNQQFASEELQRLNDFVSKTGRNVVDFYKAYGSNYDEMSDEQIMRDSLKSSNPNLSKHELDLYFKSTYKADKDKYNEDEITLGNINLKKDAAKAREELKNLQESVKKPSENYLSQDEMNNIREDWLDNLDEEVDQLEGIAFELDDKGNEFTFKLDDQDRDNLYNSNSNLDGFFNRYTDESGEWNMEKLNMEMFILNNFDRIVRSVASQNKGAGREEIIKDIKNPTYTPQQKTTERTSKTLLDQIEDELSGDRTPRKI